MTKKNVMPAISDEEFISMMGREYSHTGTGKDTESSIQADYGEITTPKSNPHLDYGGKRTTPESTIQTNDGEKKMRDEPIVREREVANAISAARAASLATEFSMPNEPTDEPAEHFAPAMPSIIPPEESVGSGNSEMSNGLFAPAMSSVSSIPKVPSRPTALAGHKTSDAITTPAVPELLSRVTAPVPELSSAITAPTSLDPIRRPSTKQRKASFDEYREAFLQAPKITDRQPVFLSRETRDRLDEIVRKLGDRKMSVSGLVENIARQHLETYGEDIEVWKRM